MMSNEEASSSKMISLKTADNVVFEVEPAIAKEIQTVQSCIDTAGTAMIPLPNVFSHQLTMIIDYLKQHRLGDAKEFDAEFTKPLSLDELKELILAVHYLNVNGLLDFLAQCIADRIHNKSVEFARKFFGVENDFTPEEEAKIHEENAWTFRGVDEDED